MSMRIVYGADGCPACRREAFWEWHREVPGLRSGGRWCPSCGYGVHPPSPDPPALP